VSDACVMATCVDGVLLALRIDKKMRNSALRAREMLTMFHANVLGVIVNCGEQSTPNSYSGGYTWDYPDAASYYHEASSVAVPLLLMIWRDYSASYRQSVVGVAWAVAKPLISMVIFSVIFGRVAGLPSDEIPYPIFAYTALLPWMYFSGCLCDSSNSVLNNSG